jgi:hypothetical protein
LPRGLRIVRVLSGNVEESWCCAEEVTHPSLSVSKAMKPPCRLPCRATSHLSYIITLSSIRLTLTITPHTCKTCKASVPFHHKLPRNNMSPPELYSCVYKWHAKGGPHERHLVRKEGGMGGESKTWLWMVGLIFLSMTALLAKYDTMWGRRTS